MITLTKRAKLPTTIKFCTSMRWIFEKTVVHTLSHWVLGPTEGIGQAL